MPDIKNTFCVELSNEVQEQKKLIYGARNQNTGYWGGGGRLREQGMIGRKDNRTLLSLQTEAHPSRGHRERHSVLSNSATTMHHAILQARILEGVALPFSRGSSQPRD